MYVDLNIRPYRDADLSRILDTARRLGYKAIAVEGLNEKVKDKLTVVPRVTYEYGGKLAISREGLEGFLIVYGLGELGVVKALNSLRGRCHLIKLSSNVLAGMRKKHIDLLRNCDIPVEISVKDIILNNEMNYNALRGLNKLLPYVERGDVELVVSSSAGNEFELIHPLEVIAILKELQLSELTSIKSVSSLPLRILRMVCNGV